VGTRRIWVGADIMTTFAVEWREQGAGVLTGSDSGIVNEFYVVSGLDPDTAYEWRVRVTDGDWTDWELFQTAEGYVYASEVAGVGAVDSAGHKSASGESGVEGVGSVDSAGHKGAAYDSVVEGIGTVITVGERFIERFFYDSEVEGVGEVETVGTKDARAPPLAVEGIGEVDTVGHKSAEYASEVEGVGEVETGIYGILRRPIINPTYVIIPETYVYLIEEEVYAYEVIQ